MVLCFWGSSRSADAGHRPGPRTPARPAGLPARLPGRSLAGQLRSASQPRGRQSGPGSSFFDILDAPEFLDLSRSGDPGGSLVLSLNARIGRESQRGPVEGGFSDSEHLGLYPSRFLLLRCGFPQDNGKGGPQLFGPRILSCSCGDPFIRDCPV